jgi:LmbE family N-acetylglucosaminyl deacetylase
MVLDISSQTKLARSTLIFRLLLLVNHNRFHHLNSTVNIAQPASIKYMQLREPLAQDQLNPKVVLGVAAHPDDLDFGAAGAMAKYAAGGADVYYLILTDGSKGSEDQEMLESNLINMRRDEQQAAAKILGIKEVFFLDYEDGLLENTPEVKRDIVRYIRKLKPDTLLTWDPTVVYSLHRGFINHPDHRACGQAALDAAFPLARDHMSFPELITEGLDTHKVKELLLLNFNEYNYVEDITDTFLLKKKAIEAHESQVPDVENMLDKLEKFAIEYGKPHGMQYGEAFMRVPIRS